MTSHELLLIGILLMAAGAPLLPTNVQKLVATVGGFIVAALGGTALSGFAWSWSHIPILAFLAAAAASTAFSKARKQNVVLPSVMRSDGLLTQALYVALALLASQLAPADRETVVRGMVWAAGFVGIVAFWQSYGAAQWALPAGAPSEMMRTDIRACGTLANPLFLGGYCALMLPLVAVRAVSSAGRPEDFVVTILLSFAAVLSGSRAAWLGILAAMPIVFRDAPHPVLAAAMWICLVVIVVVGRAKFLARASLADVVKDSVKSSVSGRRYIWKETWSQIRQRLWIGHGFNTIIFRNPDPAARDFYDTPHQSVLHVWHATGAVGAACFVAVWVAAFWHAGPFLAPLVGYGIWTLLAWEHLGPSNVFWGIVGMTAAA